jgi:octaprenyl-diphosphate synthase
MLFMTAKAPRISDFSPKEILVGIQQLVKDDLKSANTLILEQLHSDIDIIQKIANHIIQSGGKRLRPLLVLLSANYFGGPAAERHELATIIEFVHTATLLHDDVVDASLLRRGQETANQIWGNQISVLVGDFLYSRAFQLLTRRNNSAVMKVLAQTTNLIAEGEISQLVNRHDPDISEATYLEVIQRKTACLFGAAAETGALLGQCTLEQQRAMAEYGLNLGIAFQIIDDLLDYTAPKTETGKNRGDDLSEGRATLPLIYTLQHCSLSAAGRIRKAISEGDRGQLDFILETMHSAQAEKYALNMAIRHADIARSALNHLPISPFRTALDQLIRFVIERNY